MPDMPKPAKDHAWLQQLAGEWEATMKMTMAPDQPAMEMKGTEKVRMVGGFWAQTDFRGNMMGMDFNGAMTLGYDTKAGHYVGTWIDSFNDYMWRYEGKLDAAGKVLTLSTEGPSPMGTGTCKFEESTEIVDADTRKFTSKFQDADGKWQQMLTIDYKRKQ
jgi:hypothetical protein